MPEWRLIYLGAANDHLLRFDLAKARPALRHVLPVIVGGREVRIRRLFLHIIILSDRTLNVLLLLATVWLLLQHLVPDMQS